MPLRTTFRKALFAGVTALATGVAMAEIPVFDLPEDFLVQRGLSQADAQAMVRRLAGKSTVRIATAEKLNQLRGEMVKAEAAAKASGDERTVRKIRSLSFSLGTPKTLHPQELVFDKNAWTIPSNRNLLGPVFGEKVRNNDAQCLVKPLEEKNSKNLINSSTGIPLSAIERSLFTFEEMSLVAYLHELAHCNGANEEEADIAALQELHNFPVTSDLKRRWVYLRALSPDFDKYYIALPLDATFRRVPVTHADNLSGTFEDVQKQASRRVEKQNGKTPEFVAKASTYHALLSDPTIALKPLSRRMMELHIQATEAVAPKAYAQALAASHQKPVPVSGPLP